MKYFNILILTLLLLFAGCSNTSLGVVDLMVNNTFSTGGNLTGGGNDNYVTKFNNLGEVVDSSIYDNLTQVQFSKNIVSNSSGQFSGTLALGVSPLNPDILINSEFAPQNLASFSPTPVIKLTANIDNGFYPIPSGIFARMNINNGHTQAFPITFRSEISQNSSGNMLLGIGYYSVMRSETGSTGNLGDTVHLYAAPTQSNGAGIIANAYGVQVHNQGNSKVTTAIGLNIKEQTATGFNYGIRLQGDGDGGRITIGASDDTELLWNGSDFIINTDNSGQDGDVILSNGLIAQDIILSNELITPNLRVTNNITTSNINEINYVQVGNYSDIQATIDRTAVGGTVFLGNGVYQWDGVDINITKDIHLVG